MTFLAPLFAVLGAVAALGVVAVHLITTREPPVLVLPTARFVPVSTARAISRATRPSDPWLLLLRALAVLLLGAAFAHPVRRLSGPAVRNVVLMDASRAPAAMTEVRDSVARYLSEGATLVVFDSVAREFPAESLAAVHATAARPALTAALLAAHRAAIALAPSVDSIRLILVSPLSADAFDAATASIRARWPGGLTHVAVAARVDSLVPGMVEFRGSVGDPIGPAAEAVTRVPAGSRVRLVRGVADAEDFVWVRAGARVLLLWPDTVVSPRADAVTLEEGGSWVAPLGRLRLAGEGQVIARWADGAPAVVERQEGSGCVREIGVALPRAGDLTLSPGFAALLKGLLSPCGGGTRVAEDSSLRTALATGGMRAVPAALLRAEVAPDRSLALLLLGAATLVLVVELLARRRVIA